MATGDTPTQTIQALSKNLYIPISLVIGLIGVALYVGTISADVSQNKKDVMRLEASVIPRPELDGRLKVIEGNISEIKADVKSILKQGK